MNTVTLSHENIDHVMAAAEWCRDHVGEANYEITSSWPADRTHFHFDRGDQAMIFKLRWAG